MYRNQSFAVLAFWASLTAFLAVSPASISYAAEEAQVSASSPAGPLPEMAMGKPDAPVTIVEYASLSCPHCAAFYKNVFPALKSEYIDTGKVHFIMREFPHNEAALGGAVIARCVDPSRYFAFTSILFAKQEDWVKPDSLTPLRALAKQAGMTDGEFDKCINDESLQQKILAGRDEGEKKGVHSIPSFFINDKPLNGEPTLEAITEAMKPYLNKQ